MRAIQCRACDCKQEPAARCKRCGKEFNFLGGRAKPIEQLPVVVVQPKAVPEPKPDPAPRTIAVLAVKPALRTIAELEREAILGALEFYNPKEAARLLGIGKAKLYRKLQIYGAMAPHPYRFKSGHPRKKSLHEQQK
jgi:DNA-binding NtrC family response regulator